MFVLVSKSFDNLLWSTTDSETRTGDSETRHGFGNWGESADSETSNKARIQKLGRPQRRERSRKLGTPRVWELGSTDLELVSESSSVYVLTRVHVSS